MGTTTLNKVKIIRIHGIQNTLNIPSSPKDQSLLEFYWSDGQSLNYSFSIFFEMGWGFNQIKRNNGFHQSFKY